MLRLAALGSQRLDARDVAEHCLLATQCSAIKVWAEARGNSCLVRLT